MSTEFKWYGDRIQKLVDKAGLSGLTASAISVENAVVKEIERQEIVKTGRYKGSITFKTRNVKSEVRSPAKSEDGVASNPKKFEALIGTNLVYARKLEYVGKKGGAPRAAIRRGWDSIKSRLEMIYALQFKKVFG